MWGGRGGGVGESALCKKTTCEEKLVAGRVPKKNSVGAGVLREAKTHLNRTHLSACLTQPRLHCNI
jgi:hypothetical protein